MEAGDQGRSIPHAAVADAFPGIIPEKIELAEHLLAELARVLGQIRSELGYEATAPQFTCLPPSPEEIAHMEELNKVLIETYRGRSDYDPSQASPPVRELFLNPKFADENSARDIELIWNKERTECRDDYELIKRVKSFIGHPSTPTQVLEAIREIIVVHPSMRNSLHTENLEGEILLHPNLNREVKFKMLQDNNVKLTNVDGRRIAKMFALLPQEQMAQLLALVVSSPQGSANQEHILYSIRLSAYAANDENFDKLLGTLSDSSDAVQMASNPHFNEQQRDRIRAAFCASAPEAHVAVYFNQALAEAKGESVTPRPTEEVKNEDLDTVMIQIYRAIYNYDPTQANQKMKMRFLDPKFADENSARDIELIWDAQISKERLGRELLDIIGGCLNHPATPIKVLKEILKLIRERPRMRDADGCANYEIALSFHPNLDAETKIQMLSTPSYTSNNINYSEMAIMLDRDLTQDQIDQLFNDDSHVNRLFLLLAIRRSSYAANPRNFEKVLEAASADRSGLAYVHMIKNPYINNDQVERIKAAFSLLPENCDAKELFKQSLAERP